MKMIQLAFLCFPLLAIFNDIKTTAAAGNSENDPTVIDLAAFNVRIFGVKKMSNPFIVNQLVKIILRYDVILIQEIRDYSQRAIYDLLAKVNAASTSIRYNMVLSARLGRSSSKEQYAYIYNENLLTVVSQHVYDDTAKDVFQREPFVVQFSSSKLDVSSFAVAGIHTAPRDAAAEIDHLYDVYEDTKRRLGINNVILMGDFNAGCTYVTDWSSIRLATDHRFYWLINDVSDTTSGDTECAYDRIVVAGDQLLNSIEPFSPSVFHYDREYNLTKEQSLLVSDHYPVAVKIRTRKDVQSITLTRKFQVEDTSNIVNVSPTSLATILRVLSAKSAYSVEKSFNSQGQLLSFNAKLQPSDLAQSISNLNAIKTDLNPLISTVQVTAAKRHLKQLSMVEFLPKNNGFYYTLRDYYQNKITKYIVMATCGVLPNTRCSIEASLKNGA